MYDRDEQIALIKASKARVREAFERRLKNEQYRAVLESYNHCDEKGAIPREPLKRWA